MTSRRAISVFRPFAIQLAVVVTGLLALAVYPPANGPMALIALDGRSADRIAPAALADGALLLGRGPLPNILIVTGSRDRLARDLLSKGILVIAAPRRWCGAVEVA